MLRILSQSPNLALLHYSSTFVCCNCLIGCYTRDPPLAAKQPLSILCACFLRSGLPPETPGSTRDPPRTPPRALPEHVLKSVAFGTSFRPPKCTKMASFWHPKSAQHPSRTEKAEKRIRAYPPTQNPHFQGRRTPKSRQKNTQRMQ